MNNVFLYLFFNFSILAVWTISANIDGVEKYEFLSISSVIITILISTYFDFIPKRYFGINGLKYLRWLLKEILISSFYVTKTIWRRDLNLTGEFIEFKSKIKSDDLKVVFANSIALTPGTYTINIDKDEYLVHAFSVNTKNDLQTGVMESKILKLESALS